MNNQTNEKLKPLDEQPSGENETKPEASASSDELSEPSRFFEEAAGKDGKNVPVEDPFFSPLPDIDLPDDDAAEAGVSFCYGVENGIAFGTDAGGIDGIFHIAAGEYRAVITFQRGTDGEMGVGAVSTVQHGHGLRLQVGELHEDGSFPIIR